MKLHCTLDCLTVVFIFLCNAIARCTFPASRREWYLFLLLPATASRAGIHILPWAHRSISVSLAHWNAASCLVLSDQYQLSLIGCSDVPMSTLTQPNWNHCYQPGLPQSQEVVLWTHGLRDDYESRWSEWNKKNTLSTDTLYRLETGCSTSMHLGPVHADATVKRKTKKEGNKKQKVKWYMKTNRPTVLTHAVLSGTQQTCSGFSLSVV